MEKSLEPVIKDKMFLCYMSQCSSPQQIHCELRLLTAWTQNKAGKGNQAQLGENWSSWNWTQIKEYEQAFKKRGGAKHPGNHRDSINEKQAFTPVSFCFWWLSKGVQCGQCQLLSTKIAILERKTVAAVWSFKLNSISLFSPRWLQQIGLRLPFMNVLG